MHSLMDIKAPDDFSPLLKALADRPTFASHDIDRLRRALFRDGKIDRPRAAELIHANRRMRARSDDWVEFYLEALANFFLTSQKDSFCLSPGSEVTLISWIGDVQCADVSERRLILRVYLRSSRASERFTGWVLDAIEDNLLHSDMGWVDGRARSAGVIDTLDMQLIRRLVGVDNACSHRGIKPVCAAFLRNLDRGATQFVDTDSWRQLLATSCMC